MHSDLLRQSTTKSRWQQLTLPKPSLNILFWWVGGGGRRGRPRSITHGCCYS